MTWATIGKQASAVLALASGLALGIGAATAHAAAAYTYVGPAFAIFTDNNPPAGSYSAGDHVTLTFALAVALPANQPSLDIFSTVLSLTISDGRNTITEATASVASPATVMFV